MPRNKWICLPLSLKLDSVNYTNDVNTEHNDHYGGHDAVDDNNEECDNY